MPKNFDKDVAHQIVDAVNGWLRLGFKARGEGNQDGEFATSKAADELGMAKRTLREKLQTAKDQFGLEPLWESRGVPPEPVTDKERRKYQDKITDLTNKLRDAHRDDLTAESVREVIFKLRDVPASPPDWLLNERSNQTGPGVPTVIISDIHHGEVVSKKELGGLNEFNMAISEARLMLLTERVIDLCFNHMTNPDYPGIVVCLGGDMHSGDIHEELKVTNECPLPEAMASLYNILINVITTFADKFGRVFIPCVPGNHSRNNHKPQAKNMVVNNWDWLLYTMLEKYFENDKRIQFYVPLTGDAHYKLYGTRFMLTHGNNLGVKGGDGIIGALGPIARGAIKVRSSEAQAGRDFDVALIGHWHTMLWLSNCIVNGSVKGYDEYARLFLRARYERPQQALFFTHEKHGITYRVPVFLDEGMSAGTGEWVSWKKED